MPGLPLLPLGLCQCLISAPYRPAGPHRRAIVSTCRQAALARTFSTACKSWSCQCVVEAWGGLPPPPPSPSPPRPPSGSQADHAMLLLGVWLLSVFSLWLKTFCNKLWAHILSSSVFGDRVWAHILSSSVLVENICSMDPHFVIFSLWWKTFCIIGLHFVVFSLWLETFCIIGLHFVILSVWLRTFCIMCPFLTQSGARNVSHSSFFWTPLLFSAAFPPFSGLRFFSVQLFLLFLDSASFQCSFSSDLSW